MSPVTASLLERVLLSRGPAPLLELIGATGLRAVAAARRLGIFERLAADALSAAELAAEIGADPTALADLLAHLVSLGYLTRGRDRYRATAMAKRSLVVASPTDLGPFIEMWDRVTMRRWDELEQAIRTGAPSRPLYEWLDEHPDLWPVVQSGFRAVASLEAEGAARHLRLGRTDRSVVDVGGGHGLYAVAVARRYPGVRVTVVDRPLALAPAREVVAASGVADRIELRGGDMFDVDLGSGHDAALLFNVAHGLGREDLVRVVRRIRAALRPGGRLLVLDQLADARSIGPATRAIGTMIALTYRIVLGGRAWPYAELSDALRSAGAAAVRRARTPTSDLVEATFHHP